MSTYFYSNGSMNLKDLPSTVKLTVDTQLSGHVTITPQIAIEENQNYLCATDGTNYLWVDTDVNGNIQGFKRYGGNNPEFLCELVTHIDEYMMAEDCIPNAYEELGLDMEDDYAWDEAYGYVMNNFYTYAYGG